MGARLAERIRASHAALAALFFLTLPYNAAQALFHVAVIDEVMTSYGGDAEVQFVEIRMLFGSQNLVTNSVLGAFDADGSYLGDVLIVPGNVANEGAGVRWIMGTAQFAVVSGLMPDFTMPAGLPTGGGMVCWAAPPHDILDRGRCSSNALESVPPTHTPHATARFAFIRSSRAVLRAVTSSTATASPVPKYISSGV